MLENTYVVIQYKERFKPKKKGVPDGTPREGVIAFDS